MQIEAGVEPDGGIVRTVITISGEPLLNDCGNVVGYDPLKFFSCSAADSAFCRSDVIALRTVSLRHPL